MAPGYDDQDVLQAPRHRERRPGLADALPLHLRLNLVLLRGVPKSARQGTF